MRISYVRRAKVFKLAIHGHYKSATPKQSEFIPQTFVLTVYADMKFKAIPVLTKMGVALAREQSQSGIRLSDINYHRKLLITNRMPRNFFVIHAIALHHKFRPKIDDVIWVGSRIRNL